MSTSKPADGFDFITDRDLAKLEAIATSGNPGNADLEGKADELMGRDIDGPPRRSSQNKNFDVVQSRALVEISQRMTNAEAAERVGVSERTVERHRAHWLGFDDQDAVNLELTTRIDDRLCGAMRMACHDGQTMADVAMHFDISKGAVYNHVSAKADGNCSHDPPVQVERVKFKHGGMRGSPDRRVCKDCGRFVGDDHEC